MHYVKYLLRESMVRVDTEEPEQREYKYETISAPAWSTDGDDDIWRLFTISFAVAALLYQKIL